jgi:hypothetical protein
MTKNSKQRVVLEQAIVPFNRDIIDAVQSLQVYSKICNT